MTRKKLKDNPNYDKFSNRTTKVHHCNFTKASEERMYRITRVNTLFRQGCDFKQIANRMGFNSPSIAREYYYGSDTTYNKRTGKYMRGYRQVILGASCKL